MRTFVVILLFACFGGSFASISFRWLSERSADGIPHLSVTFPDGRVDHAVLNRFNPIPLEMDQTRSKVDDCIFRGFLVNDKDSKVVLTGGCPGDDKFEIGIISKGEFYRLRVKNNIGEKIDGEQGLATMGRTLPAPPVFPDGYHVPPMEPNTRQLAFPKSGFIFNLDIYYDITFVKRFGNESVNAIRRIVALSQLVFDLPTLTVPIEMVVNKIESRATDYIPANGTGLGYLGKLNMSSPAAHVKVGMTTTGQNGGIGYLGAVCTTNLAVKSAVVSAGSWGDQLTAEIMAHELGHTLNMLHDFVDPYNRTSPTPRYDADGNICTNTNGVMDYYVTVKRWSTCSVQAFKNYFTRIGAASFCMPVNKATGVNGNWGTWSSWSSCSKTCSGGVQTRTRPCDSPRPSAGGAYCAGNNTDSQACNSDKECPWPGIAIQVCSNVPSRNISCTPPKKVKVYKAGWMRRDPTVCKIGTTFNATTTCFLDITEKVQAYCNGTTESCNFKLPTGLTDPCPGIDKYFQFNFECVTLPGTV